MNTKYNHTITVLTDPIPSGTYLLSEILRNIARRARNRFRPPELKLNGSKYRGHFAVTRSLVEGLQKSRLPFNYNPRSVKELADAVIVLAGVRTLRQAIELKKVGKIKKLFAGPNIVVFSSDADSILASPEIDVVIAPSNWVIDLYIEDNSSLEGRCFAWPAGVDTEFWKPKPNIVRKHVLLFEKQNNRPMETVEFYMDYLHQKGYETSVIKYGAYTQAQYLDELQKSQLMIVFTASESQGIAWAEAWATDVPTFFKKNTQNVYSGRKYHCSTAPYLCSENGMFFDDFDDFKNKFSRWEINPNQFAARAWTLSNMSDELCASMLYKRVIAC